MLVKKDGIYKTIDAKDYGVYQNSGWEKVVDDVVPVKKAIKVAEPIVNDEEEIVVAEEPKIDELPKSKKKKK